MSSPHITITLWVLQTIIEIVIAAVLYRRKLHKEFPAFFAYVIADMAVFCIQFAVYFYASLGSNLYFEVYWSSTAIMLVFTFRVIHEVFVDVFKPYHALRDLGTALFKWAALIMILVSVALIALSPSWQDPLKSSILIIQRCVRVVQCGLLVFLLAFCGSLGVNWRRLSFGVALGFGFISASEMITTALFSGGRMQVPLVQLTFIATYDVGLLIFLFYSLANRRADMVPVLVPQRWDEALLDINVPQSEAESLIPMFEHMVDQALSKAPNTHS